MMLTRIANLLLELSQPDIIINIPAESAKTFEFHKAQKLINLGREAAREAISGYQKNQEKQVQ
jgi:NTE family protein